MKIKNKLQRIDVGGLFVTVKPVGSSWSIDYRNDGKRVRLQVGSVEECEKLVNELIAKRTNLVEAEFHEARHGGAVALARLPEVDRTAILTAWQKLTASGGTHKDMLQAVDRYVDSVLTVRQNMTLADAVRAYIESRPNRRLATVKDIRWKLNKFAERFGVSTHISEVEADAVQEWLRETLGASGRTFNAYRNHIRALCRFAVRKGWLSASPVADIEHDPEEHGTPATLSPVQANKLLETAVEKYPELVPYIVIGVFAGLRPERELGCLAWSSVDLDNARLTVTAENAKRRRARNVPLSDNAIAWLRRYAPPHPGGTVFYSRSKLRALRKKAGVPYAKDILRHSYASYLLAQCEDEAMVAARMGNSVQMVRDHYNGARNATEAAAFWAITPPESGIIKFPKVAVA
jgi:integrase